MAGTVIKKRTAHVPVLKARRNPALDDPHVRRLIRLAEEADDPTTRIDTRGWSDEQFAEFLRSRTVKDG